MLARLWILSALGAFFLSWIALKVLPMMVPPFCSGFQTFPKVVVILSFEGKTPDGTGLSFPINININNTNSSFKTLSTWTNHKHRSHLSQLQQHACSINGKVFKLQKKIVNFLKICFFLTLDDQLHRYIIP